MTSDLAATTLPRARGDRSGLWARVGVVLASWGPSCPYEAHGWAASVLKSWLSRQVFKARSAASESMTPKDFESLT